ncbi:MAG: PorT family protein [Chitinophagales bacterium]|nr:PorT family protein [Chitinophagales bacterium]
MKRFLLLCLIYFWVATANSQEGFHLGASGTFSSTWILNQNNYGTLEPFQKSYVKQSEMDYLPTWGGNAGVVLGYTFPKNIGVQAELQYNVTGQKYEDNFEGPATVPVDSGSVTLGSASVRVNVKRNIKLQYLQIPILFKALAGKSEKAKFFVCIGPQIGFRTYAFEEVKVGDIPYSNLPFKASEKFKAVDVGLALQTGVEIYATRYLFIDIGLSAYGGLNDLNSKAMKELEWYSKNDVSYQKSYNFRAGLMVGVHYVFVKWRDKERLQY